MKKTLNSRIQCRIYKICGALHIGTHHRFAFRLSKTDYGGCVVDLPHSHHRFFETKDVPEITVYPFYRISMITQQ